MKQRTVLSILSVLLLLCLLSACSQSAGNNPESDSSVTTEEESTQPETEKPEPTYLCYTAENGAEFSVIRAEKPTGIVFSLAMAFQQELEKRFEAKPGIASDFLIPGQSPDPAALEILIGDTTREESAELRRLLDEKNTSCFGIYVSDTKIAVCGTSDYLTYIGLDYLLKHFTAAAENGGKQLRIENGFCYIEETDRQIPNPETLLASGTPLAFYVTDKVVTVPSRGGYTVMQGGGTDGTYAYYAMINKGTTPETARIYKYDLKTWKLVKTSENLPTAHSNDITYDAKNNRLVVSYCSGTDGWKGIVFLNPDTLEFLEYVVAPVANRGIEYLPEQNRYIIGCSYTIYLTDENFNPISSFTCSDPQYTTQGLYSDGTYVYDVRWNSELRNVVQPIVIHTLSGKYICTANFYGMTGEPENIFRSGDYFYIGCNGSCEVYRAILLPASWW